MDGTKSAQRQLESPGATSATSADSVVQAGRPLVMGCRGAVSAGHYLAAVAGLQMLEKGGNAIDAGVAAGLCLNVVHNDFATLGGVAPIIIYHAESARTITLAGIGSWPEAMTRQRLLDRYGGIPDNHERCVVPAAAAAWLQALRDYGTLSFDIVSEPARRYARDGFPVHPFLNNTIAKYIDNYREWEENRKLFLVDGEAAPIGTIIRQPDLHASLEALVSAEQTPTSGTRGSRIQAVIDYFYRGPIAEAMVSFGAEHGSLLSLEDFATYTVSEDSGVRVAFGDWEVAACGPWSQGPALPMTLNVLKNFDLHAMGHNSPTYINTVASALDLAFADRNAYCGDPDFVDVPMAALLDPEYGRLRAGLIVPDQAFQQPMPPGDPVALAATSQHLLFTKEDFSGVDPVLPPDTSCVTAVDHFGNMFSATPSDGYCSGPIIPGIGLSVSERGSQAFLTDGDPNSVEPRKRPRLTPNPALLFRHGEPFAAMATPGNDRQVQAMVQVFLNMAIFGMSPQQAVEAPRFASFNFRASTWPGNTEPGRLCLERDIDPAVAETLTAWGRDVAWWPRLSWPAGGVCMSLRHGPGVYAGAADPRRENYAVAL